MFLSNFFQIKVPFTTIMEKNILVCLLMNIDMVKVNL